MTTGSPADPADAQAAALSRAFYDRALAEGGDDAERVGWESPALQRLRFEALLEAVAERDLRDPRVRLLDVGCGLGDLLGHLRATGRRVDYLGVDLHPQMVAAARRRHPEGRFERADVLTMQAAPGAFDVVICSGALSTWMGSEATSWRFIERLIALARWVAAFNLQRRCAGPGALRADFWHVDPDETLPRLRRLSGGRVSWREDALNTEVIVAVYQDYCRALRGLEADATPEALAEGALHQRRPAAALRALAAAPPSPEADNLRAVALATDGDVAQARQTLERALAARPEALEAATNLAALLIAQAAPAQAAQVAARALDAAQGAPAARRDALRALVHPALLAAGDEAGAEALATTAETEHARCVMLAAQRLGARQVEAAAALLTRALELRPWDLGPHVGLGQAALLRGDSAAALDHAAEVLRRAPEHLEARGQAARAVRSLARLGGAARDAAMARARAHLDHPVLGPLLRRIGG